MADHSLPARRSGGAIRSVTITALDRAGAPVMRDTAEAGEWRPLAHNPAMIAFMSIMRVISKGDAPTVATVVVEVDQDPLPVATRVDVRPVRTAKARII
jgi:hypothetical protein